eukprot:CAMPEP_0184011770 /NCGR_PEP_ID=MMETSP0954-20121128/4012_1 /TAXON_ID=627963 /ORGANISM="Aplanochytrium sp, Strain PBS07" /LENGTH=535 /DNA_ID=CAMNT_0026291625 /DNA_START=152 /DNA_END=1756 /DNA_ORIENTATION=-
MAAWGQVEKPSQLHGLSDIMSEQMAETVTVAATSTPKAPFVSSEDDDLAKAIALSLQETPPEAPSNTKRDEVPPSIESEQVLSDDFALALQLQEEEEASYVAFRNREMSYRQGHKVSLRPRFVSPEILDQFQESDKIIYSADDAHDFPEIAPRKAPNSRKPPWITRPKHLKGQGGDEEIITKHDAEICGRRNAAKLSKNLSENYTTGDLGSQCLSNRVSNSLKSQLKKQNGGWKGVGRTVGKDAHQTHAKGLDQKTRLLLQAMVNIGILDEINGAIRTGKEAIVYHAEGPSYVPEEAKIIEIEGLESLSGSAQTENREYAVKVFKTTLNQFKRRADYVEGDHRFLPLNNLSRQNPRLILQVWAERELKNLVRLSRAGIPCPRPVRLMDNVLLMTFLGRNGWAAPQLRETNLSRSKYLRCFVQVALMMRAMYHDCNLIHADLSEYNILYFESKCFILDVGQAVLKDHEKADAFLKRDCENILSFFSKRGLDQLVSVDALYAILISKEERSELTTDETVLSQDQKKSIEYADRLGSW